MFLIEEAATPGNSTPFFYKQSMFDTRPEKLFSSCLLDGLLTFVF